MSCGIKESEQDTIERLIANGCTHFCIDVAHGHSEQVGNMIRFIKEQCLDDNLSIIAGNVCT